ncbi:peptidoglycan-binding protein [Streptomyces sp. NPDC002187]|uniref:peptidoglycan-binding protein n=1 Tax=Streptomyces sp. NPDC002187 TaxID=3364637 RepID=UPI0036B2029E
MSESGTSSDSNRSEGHRRRRRLLLGVAGGAVLLTAAAVLASTGIKSPAQAAADAGPPPADVLTAPVERRVLTDSLVVRGTVVAGQTLTVAPVVGGGGEGGAAKPVVTKLPLKAGKTFKGGQLLVEISGRPVFALKGRIPAYRDLKPGAEGDDVAQLQRALSALGHGTGTDAPGRYGTGTKAALNALYRALGYEPQPAQPDAEESAKAAQATVTAARRAWQDAEPGVARTRASEDYAAARAESAAIEARSGPMLPVGEVVYLESFPARVDSLGVRLGGEAGTEVMTVSAGRLVVEGNLAPHEKGLVRAGLKVLIHSELTGTEAVGRVGPVTEGIAAPAAPGASGAEQEGQTQPENGGLPGFTMHVTPDKPLPPELAGQDVRLTVQAASSDGKVLVVPVSAVFAGADSRTTVMVAGPGKNRDTRRRVEVRVGISGDGFVEVQPVRGGRLSEGDRVVVGETKAGAP